MSNTPRKSTGAPTPLAGRAALAAPLVVAALLAGGCSDPGDGQVADGERLIEAARQEKSLRETQDQAFSQLRILGLEEHLSDMDRRAGELQKNIQGLKEADPAYAEAISWLNAVGKEKVRTAGTIEELQKGLPQKMPAPKAQDEDGLTSIEAEALAPVGHAAEKKWGSWSMTALGVAFGLAVGQIYRVLKKRWQARKDGLDGAKATSERETRPYARPDEDAREMESARKNLAESLGALKERLPAGQAVRIRVENASILLWKELDVVEGGNVIHDEVKIARGLGDGTRGVALETGEAQEGDEQLPQPFGKNRTCNAAWATRVLEEGSQDAGPEGLAALAKEAKSMATLWAREKRELEAQRDA